MRQMTWGLLNAGVPKPYPHEPKHALLFAEMFRMNQDIKRAPQSEETNGVTALEHYVINLSRASGKQYYCNKGRSSLFQLTNPRQTPSTMIGIL